MTSTIPYAFLGSLGSGGTGVATLVADYGPTLPHIGSSSSVVDRRSARPPMGTPVMPVTQVTPTPSVVSNELRGVIALSVSEQMQELLAALSINKSQLAEILRVTRPTVYDWLQGREPNAANADRLHALLRALTRASVSAAAPLNARFVRRAMELDSPSIIELLTAEHLDEGRIAQALEQARSLGEEASTRRTSREDRLRGLGFEDPPDDERRERLARNAALQDWPGR
jgi:transcriptional regulator with XRE-family HTH domain